VARLTTEQKMKLVITSKFGARVFSSEEFFQALDEMFPNEKHGNYLLADYTVNRETGKHQAPKHFLFAIADGKFRIFDSDRDGSWINQKQVFRRG
jgi:hypothetical protein